MSEETIRSLVSHVSRRMLEHYSHIRTRAKEEAIRTLEQPEPEMLVTQRRIQAIGTIVN